MADAAAAAGLSVRLAYHWPGRYRTGGERMLRDRSSAPVRYRAARCQPSASPRSSSCGASSTGRRNV
ncbi:MAG: hypothetical protein JO305_02695 [Alphaproteobacteria bacterium]|nr:hypothetical protein [Alphaproteobacteria bacterium]